MTHKERLLAAISHQEPDKIPIDFGGTCNSSVVLEKYEELKVHFGIEAKNVFTNQMMRVVDVHESLLQALDIDTRYVGPLTEVAASEPTRYIDIWGVEREKIHFYYDQRKFPLAGDITVADITSYPWPDPDDPRLWRGYKERIRGFRENTDAAVCLYIPPPFIHISQFLRGFMDWYCDLALNPRRSEALFDAVLEHTLQIAKNILREVGQEVDIVCCGDDMGAQNGLQFSRDHYLKYVKPRHAKYFRQVHDLSPAKLHFHTCGSVASVIQDLIEIGVDVLNPVNVAAAGMNPLELKKNYGDRIAFWGGMDTQGVLPKGSAADVKKMVEERIEQMGEGGGYVLSATHNIQPDVPLENILVMFRHAREYRPSFAK